MTFEKSSRNTLLVGQTWIITTMSWPYYNNNATRSRSSSIHYFNYEFSPPLSSSSFFSFATFQTLMTLQFWPTFGFLQPIDVSHRHRHAQGSTFDTLFENLQYVKIVKNASHFLKFAFAFQAKIFGGFLYYLSLCPDTLFENYPKMSHLNFDLLKMTCLVTLFDRNLQLFKKSPKLTIFWHF